MSDSNTLGGLVRHRRLESGYSLGQLASKVGKTAAEVRAWERGAELPEHGILERLAETLELDLSDIQARLVAAQEAAAKEAAEAEEVAKESAEAEEEPPAEKPATKKKPKGAAAEQGDTPEPASEEPADDDEIVKTGEPIVIDPDVPVEFPEEPAAAADDAPGFAVADPSTPPQLAAEPAGDESAPGLLEAPTEPVPVPVITDTAAAARAGRAAALLEEPPPPLPQVEAPPDADPGLLRYLEPVRILFDPHSRYLYWIRAGLTTVVMIVFAWILLNQLGNLLDAVGELLDTIEPAATNPDDLDALGAVTR